MIFLVRLLVHLEKKNQEGQSRNNVFAKSHQRIRALLIYTQVCSFKKLLTEEILSITAGSDRGSYAKPL